MAITTLSGVNSGILPPVDFYKSTGLGLGAGIPYSLAYTPGYPPSITVPTGATGTALTSLVGQLPFPAATSGNTYLAKLEVSANASGLVVLYDRLWHNGSLSTLLTTSQTINSVAWPARDLNGTTSGEGVYIGLEVSATTGAGTPTLTLGYTNSQGTAGRTATSIMGTIATSAQGVFYVFGLQNGDTGVQSVQSLTLSATWTTGTMNLVAFRSLARLSIPRGRGNFSIDAFTGGMPRMFDNSVPMLLFQPRAATTGITLSGYLSYTRG